MADLLGHEGLTRRAARAAALQAAKERAALGMDRAARGSERTCPGFVEIALAAVKRYAAANPGTFSVEQMRTVLEEELPRTIERRVWGVITVEAIKAGYIERVPKVFIPAASSNGTVKPAWRAGKGARL